MELDTHPLSDVHNKLIASAVERVWPGAAWSAEALVDGMTNRNFKVTVSPVDAKPRVVVIQEQLPEDMAHAVGILRSNQMRIWATMTALGLAPELIAAFDDIEVTVVEFVEGTRLSDVADRGLGIQLTANALRVLHEHTTGDTTIGLVSDPFAGMSWLEQRIRAESPRLLEDFRWALDILDRIRAARGPYEVCQVHTDATHVNIILAPGGDRITLLDWEYVGAGDRYLDLAHFAARAELDPAEELLLVESYQGGPDERALAIVRVYRFLSMLREALWSVLADGLDFLEDFDHAQYARECLQRMAATARSEIFQRSLVTLEQTR